MKRVTSLLVLILLLGSGVAENIDSLECYTGHGDAINIESGFNYCARSIEFVGRDIHHMGVVGQNHPFNNTKIDLTEGPCFLHYTKKNVFTFCYCTTTLCNVPQETNNYDRLAARLNLESLGNDLDY